MNSATDNPAVGGRGYISMPRRYILTSTQALHYHGACVAGHLSARSWLGQQLLQMG